MEETIRKSQQQMERKYLQQWLSAVNVQDLEQVDPAEFMMMACNVFRLSALNVFLHKCVTDAKIEIN